VSQLRRKLDRDPRNSLVIETVWAHGYRLSIQARSIAS
jgi:DNA-binding response OmpR family regulator